MFSLSIFKPSAEESRLRSRVAELEAFVASLSARVAAQSDILARSRSAGHNRVAELDKYKVWVLTRPTASADLQALWAETRQGELPLGCWCVNATAGDGSPQICHAQVLAELLRERFGVES